MPAACQILFDVIYVYLLKMCSFSHFYFFMALLRVGLFYVSKLQRQLYFKNGHFLTPR